MQQVLLTDALNTKTTAAARAQVARAWDVLEERKRVLRMKPKPKDVDVSPRKTPGRRPASIILDEMPPEMTQSTTKASRSGGQTVSPVGEANAEAEAISLAPSGEQEDPLVEDD